MRKYMQRLECVIPKISCNAVMDPLVCVQTSTRPRQSSGHTFLGWPPFKGSCFNRMWLVLKEGCSHRTAERTFAKEMQTRHHQNQSWWWEPDRPASLVRHGDLTNVSKETQGIFLEWRRHSSLERLFRNSCLYHECRSNTGKSPVVVVILMSRNLNVHKDGVIWGGTSLWALVGEHFLWFCLRCAKKLCQAVTN